MPQWGREIKRLFDGYVDRKETGGVLDYDDFCSIGSAVVGRKVAGPILRKPIRLRPRRRVPGYECVEAGIVYAVADGKGVTVVGDDAQAIYSFRAATMRQHSRLPEHYPSTKVITLEQNYRST